MNAAAQRMAVLNNAYYPPADNGNEYMVYPQQNRPAYNVAAQGQAAAAVQQQQQPPPGRKQIQSFFMSDSLRSDLQKKTLLMLRGTNPDDPLVSNLPKTIHRYHSLYPLEDITKDKAVSRVFGMPSFCYKVISMTDGKTYVLRKVDTPRVQQHEYGMQAIELWKSIQHPGA